VADLPAPLLIYDNHRQGSTLITQEQLRDVIGATAYDRDGDKIGKIGNVFYDDHTDQPKWITVNTGFLGTSENFVPLAGATSSGDGNITVDYDKATIKDAPHIAEEGHLSPEDEERLYRHYNLEYGNTGNAGYTDTGYSDTGYADTGVTGRHADRQDTGHAASTGYDDDRGTVGHDTSGPTTDNAMTRSEERLNVGTETREAGRARLRKHVVTEQQQVTVPVAHEELRVEREPITDANRGDAYDGPAISEEEHEVTLRAERPVVSTETEAVERVRLGTETVRSEETVSGQVRKEEIEVDDDSRVTDRDRQGRDRV
jgi:uncharacterized protein (TIGR02271 family)